MKFMPILLAILLVASAVAPGFSTSQDSELILRVAMQDDMKGTNPITVSDVWSWNVLGYLYDGPVSVNPETDELIPYIAIGSAALSGKADGWSDCAIGNFGYSPKSVWENSTKQETIIFYDFENVKWHDGHQMDARDIIFSMHLAGQVPEWSSSMNPLKDHGGRVGSSNYSTTRSGKALTRCRRLSGSSSRNRSQISSGAHCPRSCFRSISGPTKLPARQLTVPKSGAMPDTAQAPQIHGKLRLPKNLTITRPSATARSNSSSGRRAR
jgi:ABC-type transport system substrate-binding protein